MPNFHSSRFCLAACLLGACAAAGLSALPASAQPTPPVPAKPAPAPAANPVPPAPAAPLAGVTPAQGAAQALDQAHTAKTVSALNPYLTNESAAFLGFTLVLADSLISGMASAFTPNGKSPQAATEKAFQDKVDALLNRYSLTDKMLDPSKKADSLPPALITHGHQFLSDASALSESYEKSHASAKSKTIGSQMNGSDLPTSSQCTFKVLSPTHVKIVPRGNPKSSLEAHLEDGQWRIDMIGLMDDSAPSHSASTQPKPKPRSKPKPKMITPQAAAFTQAVYDGDAAAVGKMLKSNPTLANLRLPGQFDGDAGPDTNPPLFDAVFFDEIPVVALLLKAGAKVDAEDEDGETPLADAAVFDRKEAAAILLAHGAAIGHRNTSGETALHEAVWHNSFGTAELLLAHGADVNARDNTGKTPLAVALSRSDYKAEFAAIINLLRQHGAKK